MSKKKKVFATSAAAVLAASAVTPAVTFAAEKTFPDLPSNEEMAEAINSLVESGVIQGFEDGTFRPNDTVTRAQSAEMLYKAFDLSADGTEDYTDVESDDWFYKAVVATTNAGIFEGYDGKFNPDDNLTREQAAKILVEAFDLEGSADLSFEDADDISDWAMDYIETAYANGIIKGREGNVFDPQASITRAEFAVMVKRAMDAVAEPAVVGVTALNALEVKVTFNVAVDKTSAETVTNYKIGGNTPTDATLSEDKKSVVLRFATSSQVEVENAVLVVEPIKTAKDANVKTAKYVEVFSYDDTVRPTVTSVSYPTNTTAKVTFSEPVNVENLEDYITIKDQNGNEVDKSGLFTLSTDKKSFTVDTSKFKKDESYTLYIIGLTDFGGNLISPNPSEVTIVKAEVDTVKPKVESVTALDTDKFKVVFSEAIDTSGTYFTYSIDGGASVTVNSGNATVNSDKTEFVVTLGTPVNPGPHTVVIEGYKDASENKGDKFSKLINFQADTVKPSVESTSVKTIDGVRYIAVTFSEEIELNAQDLSFTFIQDGVLNSGTIKSSALSEADIDKDGANETVLINTQNFDGAESTLKSGEYTISLPANLVNDTSQNKNYNVAKKVKVTLGELSDTDTTKPGVSSVEQTDNNTVEVVFSEKVSNETALNVANYTVEGKQVFEKAVFIGDKTKVRLTLKESSITLNGKYQIEIKNIKDLAGNMMNPYKITKELTENVPPKIKSAKLTANNKITLTFSENIDISTVVEEVAEADFDVYIDNVKETGVVESVVDGKTVTLTLSDPLNSKEYNSTITIKPTSNLDVTDVNGNTLATFSMITVAK